MLSKLWNFVRGYVIIEVTGFSVERFINLAVHKGVVFAGIDKGENDVTRMRLSVRDFWLLKIPARKTKCKVKITGRGGLPFLMRRYGKRKLLAAGALFFVAALFALSSFIWKIEVLGTERLDADAITAFLKGKGLETGIYKRGVNVRWLEKQIMAHFYDVNWSNVEIRGTKAIIRITETLADKDIYDYTTPADIVAKKDALILGIAATSGVPMVRAGDVVSQGDVLVSGLLTVGTADTVLRTEYVRAEADVTAKVVYEMEVFAPFQYIERNLSGEQKRFYGIEIFGKKIGLKKYNVKYINYEIEMVEWQLSVGSRYPMPFKIHTAEYREVISEIAVRTEEQAKFHANELIAQKLTMFELDADIMDVTVNFTVTDNYVRARAVVVTVEQIGTERLVSSN